MKTPFGSNRLYVGEGDGSERFRGARFDVGLLMPHHPERRASQDLPVSLRSGTEAPIRIGLHTFAAYTHRHVVVEGSKK
jgi:hypothetical protein